MTDRWSYDPWGYNVHYAGKSDTPFLFVGAYGIQTDPNGLINMRARYYNPTTLSFISPDPSGFNGGPNFYLYGNGNPLLFVDLNGLKNYIIYILLDHGTESGTPARFETARLVNAASEMKNTTVYIYPVSCYSQYVADGLRNNTTEEKLKDVVPHNFFGVKYKTYTIGGRSFTGKYLYCLGTAFDSEGKLSPKSGSFDYLIEVNLHAADYFAYELSTRPDFESVKIELKGTDNKPTFFGAVTKHYIKNNPGLQKRVDLMNQEYSKFPSNIKNSKHK